MPRKRLTGGRAVRGSPSATSARRRNGSAISDGGLVRGGASGSLERRAIGRCALGHIVLLLTCAPPTVQKAARACRAEPVGGRTAA
jgi:hypothetical protein